MQSDVLTGAQGPLHWCSSRLQKLRNRIQQYPKVLIVTLPGHEFLSIDLPDVIRVGKMALSDNAGCGNDGLCMNFTVYQQLIVDSNLLQSQYCTSQEGQDATVSPRYIRDHYTGHCSRVSAEGN
jgi:hypothetical protein